MGESWSTHSSPFAAPLLLSLLTAGAAGGCTASLDPGGGTTPDAGPDLPPLQQDLSQRSVPDSGPEINDATAPDAAADIAPKGYTRIKAGTFTMGCSPGDKQCCRFNCNWPFDQEKPHKVIISRDFWMKKGEVTQGQYQKMTGLDRKSVV